MSEVWIWLAIGFLGQALFSCRFIVQWLVSEREGRSVIPRAFWYFSLFGGMTLLIYAVHKQDPIFIVGQAGGVSYTRETSTLSDVPSAARRTVEFGLEIRYPSASWAKRSG